MEVDKRSSVLEGTPGWLAEDGWMDAGDDGGGDVDGWKISDDR